MNTIGATSRAAAFIGTVALALAFAAGAQAQNQGFQSDDHRNPNSSDNPWPYARTDKSPVLAVVGDVACEPDADFETGESAHETCDTPKPPYFSTSNPSTPPGSYSLWQSQEATASEIESIKPDAVALLGDLQYQVGQYQDFEKSYDLTFGAFKGITRPAPGNHEFYDEHGQTGVAGYGYFSYFNGFQINGAGAPITATLGDPCPSTMTGCGFPGATAPNPQPIPRSDGQAGHFEQTGGVGATLPPGGVVGVGDGWYSYNLGGWHLISLNIECETQPGGCSNSSGTWLAAETEWLKQDLANDHSPCTLAYWHQPTYSGADSLTEEGITAGVWWQLLYDAGADLVLNGHDHLYARYAPIKPYFAPGDTSVTGVTGTWLGTADPRRGIREFIVGTGGETLDTLVTAPTSSTDYDGTFNQQFLQAGTGNYWGVMALTLDPDGYQWDYESALEAPVAPAGTPATFSDKGSAACHGGPFGNFFGF
ncbi:MAG TPA: metallophosphoesterase [Candidatus Baltobacteraceae bacterium]|nr:metallophosphoesterase [Candidatus Baltobacteraceae bacterium]